MGLLSQSHMVATRADAAEARVELISARPMAAGWLAESAWQRHLRHVLLACPMYPVSCSTWHRTAHMSWLAFTLHVLSKPMHGHYTKLCLCVKQCDNC